ncbi:uncharacterized protein LOC119669693 [Teleopsis dalmanni]|uniref:uncharacterized protein LOC119669693 n=1 Tax=Teleopsis dalmanni TaxID=139649 RepID=UPI0018CDF04A|nr:uncharacterized protein LOC119669693 [Teleopsis dalmanni]
MLYIRNQREYMDMLEMQEKVMESSKKQTKINESRMDELRKEHTEMRERFIQTSNFINQCADKMHLAENDIKEQHDLGTKLRQRIEELTKSLQELDTFRKTLNETVKEFLPYEKIMEDVVRESGTFQSVKDFMDRCDALLMTNIEIAKLGKQKIEEIEKLRALILKMTDTAALTILGLKNELNQLLCTYTEAYNECNMWEDKLSKARDEVIHKQIGIERSRDGIHQMYKMLCTRIGRKPTLQRAHVEQVLDFIQNEVQVLRKVTIRCEEETQKNLN